MKLAFNPDLSDPMSDSCLHPHSKVCMSQAIDQHRTLIRHLGGYAQTDQQRIELLKTALSQIADECLVAEAVPATLVGIRAVAVAAWHGATEISDPYAVTDAVL
nr:hypothetical protein [uncultured Lichenicoccus sp.]